MARTQIKNPSQKGRYPGLPAAGPPPAYSEEQRKQFGSYAWIAAEDPSLLDVAGAELLLIGAKGGVHVSSILGMGAPAGICSEVSQSPVNHSSALMTMHAAACACRAVPCCA